MRVEGKNDRKLMYIFTRFGLPLTRKRSEVSENGDVITLGKSLQSNVFDPFHLCTCGQRKQIKTPTRGRKKFLNGSLKNLRFQAKTVENRYMWTGSLSGLFQSSATRGSAAGCYRTASEEDPKSFRMLSTNQKLRKHYKSRHVIRLFQITY